MYMRGGGRHSDMKLFILLSIAALAACDYSGPQPETPSEDFGSSKRPEQVEESTIAPGKPYLSFKNSYQGAFPPYRFPSPSFLSIASYPSFGQSLKAFNLAASPQGIIPPISQVIPPQFSQIVPPISQVVPPIFGNTKPPFPIPSFPSPSFPAPSFPSSSSSSSLPSPPLPSSSSSSSLPSPPLPSSSSSSSLPSPLPSSSLPSAPVSQLFSSPLISRPLFNRFTSQFYPLYQYPFAFPSTFSFLPSTFSFPTQPQKQPAKTQTETLSTSYGPPASGPVEPEPSGPAESSAPFDQAPSPVSFPYEPAAPEEPEPEAPHKPAQEYGPPSSK